MWLKIATLIWSFIRATIVTVGYEYLKDLLNLALEFVREIGSDPNLTNDEKREWVRNKLRDRAIQSGNPIADSLLNMIIEIALQRAKGEKKP